MLDNFSRHMLVAAAALTFVAGCSGNSGSAVQGQSALVPSLQHVPAGMRLIQGSAVEGPYLVPLVRRPWNLPHVWPAHRRHHRVQILFVADPQHNQILMYNPNIANPSPKGSITTGIDYVFGLAVDKSSALYAANLLGGNGGNGSITVYPKGATKPSLTITSGCAGPYGITVDGNGNVFATMLNNDTIVGYKAGQTSPFETISFGSFGQALGIDVDSSNNLWVASDTNNAVFEIPAGSTTPKNANLTGLNGSIMISIGQSNQMFVSNFGGSNVTVYAYGTTTPQYTITQGIEKNGPTLNGLTSSDFFFQSNQNGNVSGYKKAATSPFSTISGIPDPRGIASIPLVTK